MVSVTACCGEETLVKNSLWWRVGWGPGENSRNKWHFLTWLSLVLSMLSLKFSTQVFPFPHVSLIGPTSSERLSKFSFWEAVWFGNGMLVTIIMNVPDTHTIYIFLIFEMWKKPWTISNIQWVLKSLWSEKLTNVRFQFPRSTGSAQKFVLKTGQDAKSLPGHTCPGMPLQSSVSVHCCAVLECRSARFCHSLKE